MNGVLLEEVGNEDVHDVLSDLVSGTSSSAWKEIDIKVLWYNRTFDVSEKRKKRNPVF